MSEDISRLPEALLLYANGPYEQMLNAAAAEIERLLEMVSTHEADRDRVNAECAKVAEENCRLREALWHIAQDEFSEAYEHCEDGQNDYWRVVNIARECSSGPTPGDVS